jgi:hypothetical protein
VAVGYAIIAAFLFVTAPSQHVTSQPFRLEFSGATQGRYPNGMKFSAAEIVNTPILLRVFNDNNLAEFTNFRAFSKAVYVVESNRAYERLAAEYQARLADPKLNPIDRDRIQKEFELKRESINKNEYAVNFVKSGETKTVPDATAKKVLIDILNAWANFATNEQHVVEYRLAVLSPQIVEQTGMDRGEALIDVQILRSRLMRVLENIDQISELPAADLARTKKDQLSLAEIRVRLEELIRFRLEPLVPTIISTGLVRDTGTAIRFLENQMAYDQRQLKVAQQRAETYREALALYANTHASGASATAAARPAGTARPAEGETIMPQLSDTFIDRLLTLTSNAVDAEYRQELVEDYQKASEQIVPFEQALAYDTEALEQVRRAPRTGGADATSVSQQISTTRAEAKQLVESVNDIYREVSRNLNPSTQLFALTGPASMRAERGASIKRLATYGVLLLLLALPVIIGIALLHNRIREEGEVVQHEQVIPEREHPLPLTR